MSSSVSALSASHRKPFDKLGQAMRLIRSKEEQWPRLKYTFDARLVQDAMTSEHKFALLFDETSKKTLAHVQREESNIVCVEDLTEELLHQALMSNYTDELNGANLAIYSYASCMTTPDEVVSFWESTAREAASEGTVAHRQMELFLNSRKCDLNNSGIHNGIRFLHTVMIPRKAKIFRTEWNIYSREAHIAGSVDAVFRKEDGHLIIVDFKRSEKLEEHMRAFDERSRMKSPLSHIPDCDGGQYALQLSLYATILERHYGYTVDELFVCSLHPTKAYNAKLPFLRDEAMFLLDARKNWFHKWTEASSAASSSHVCCRSKRIPQTPWRLSDGRLVDRAFVKAKDKRAKPASIADCEMLKTLLPPLTFIDVPHDGLASKDDIDLPLAVV
eukprot:6211836-Pleurochrysis_carterae.AAC.1